MKEKKHWTVYEEHIADIINTQFPVQSASWIKGFILMFIIGIALLCLYNYFIDPFNYFSKEYKPVWNYAQYYKANYILQNPKKYDCFVVGGSNSGVLNPEVIEEYTDYKTYSMTFLNGNWYNYYTYINFLVTSTNAKCILLHLSSTDLDYNREDIESMDTLKPPAVLKDNLGDEIKEISEFLLKQISARVVLNDESVVTKKNGMYDWSKMKEQFENNPDSYVQQFVLNDYEGRLSELKSVDLNEENIEEALDYAKKIKKLCDENNVKLVVVCGPVFISKRSSFECDVYYDYLKQLISIMDIYDFSDITEINSNPYNFYDTIHYNDIMGNKVIKEVFGKEQTELKGIKLTKENVDEYIANRRKKFTDMLEEYKNTGTIQYQSYDNISRIRE